MMTQAFYTGISGLKSGQAAIDVEANNIANISTVGFRAYNAEFANLFEDALTAAASGISNSIGIGSKLQSSTMRTETGSFALSDRSTDMALEGDGWFGILDDSGEAMYTRAGSFTFDQNSDLVNPVGEYVLGSMAGNIDLATNSVTNDSQDAPLGDVTQVEKLSFPNTLVYPAEPTTYATFAGNIGTENVARTIGASAIDPEGNRNHLQLTFSNPQITAAGTQWDVVATAESLDGTIIYDTQNGVVNFNSNGSIGSTTLSSINNNGAQVSIDLGSGYTGVASIANTPISSTSSSDGVPAGDLIGYDVNRNAEVVATFTNGKQVSIAQIAVFHFRNNQGLERVSGANFKATTNSGEPFFMQNAQGENIIGAQLATYRLENSNVALEESLTQLIILQRSFDANSKSITTADQMIQKALNMSA
ncbi:flagellar hook-basal body complex protein [Sulfurimonas sp.]|uniref:flagellar hook-basal body complex protein n=1 Tax=Sulfurimonas sp. TaxID=2022749 RepID=UPI003562DFA0